MTPLYITLHLNGLNSIVFNNQKTGKTSSRLQKNKSVDKYYQIAKPDEFLFIVKL